MADIYGGPENELLTGTELASMVVLNQEAENAIFGVVQN